MSEILPYTILYIEDESAIRENYLYYLRKTFASVYEAEDGIEAYKIYKQKKPQLMIVDINIPKLNGLEFIKKVRKYDRESKIIVVSGHSEVNFLLEATELMLTKYLIKPITRNELKQALNVAIDDLSSFKISSTQMIRLRENYSYNLQSEELLCYARVVPLTKQESKMLRLFFLNINFVLTYEEIIYALWDSYEEGRMNSIKTLIKNLRQKLPQDSIENISAVGYKLSI